MFQSDSEEISGRSSLSELLESSLRRLAALRGCSLELERERRG